MNEHGVEWRSFEDEVFDAIKRALTSGILPLSEPAKVRRNAEYAAHSTGNKIKIEIAIEAFRRDASEPFLIWLWECKHKVNREVEVGDVRELHSKIQEIGVSRASGSIVTTLGFQSGAINLAESLGISLFRLEKRLVAITKYAEGEPKTLREVIFSVESFDFASESWPETRFDDLVRYGVRQLLAKQ